MAEADLATILEDRTGGFGWDITLTDPDGVVYTDLVGMATDISQALDPETGTLVSGHTASVALRISTLKAKGVKELPQSIADSDLKPWLVSMKDINNLQYVFKVSESRPDRALGIIVCFLEIYKI